MQKFRGVKKKMNVEVKYLQHSKFTSSVCQCTSVDFIPLQSILCLTLATLDDMSQYNPLARRH